jgi:hypothetical protein
MYYGRATRSRQKWLGGELYAILCLKNITPHTYTLRKRIRHELFHIFGVSTTVNLIVTALFINH